MVLIISYLSMIPIQINTNLYQWDKYYSIQIFYISIHIKLYTQFKLVKLFNVYIKSWFVYDFSQNNNNISLYIPILS